MTGYHAPSTRSFTLTAVLLGGRYDSQGTGRDTGPGRGRFPRLCGWGVGGTLSRVLARGSVQADGSIPAAWSAFDSAGPPRLHIPLPLEPEFSLGLCPGLLSNQVRGVPSRAARGLACLCSTPPKRCVQAHSQVSTQTHSTCLTMKTRKQAASIPSLCTDSNQRFGS